MTLPIIGMSPGNSDFIDYEVSYLLTAVIRKFGRAVVFIADTPAISTYLGLRYSFNRARDKALSKGRNLKNRVRKIMKQLQIPKNKVVIINWDTDVNHLNLYKEAYNTIANLYRRNDRFLEDVKSTTLQLLTNTGKLLNSVHESIITATHYLLSELTFMEVANNLFKTDRAVYIYHHEWPIYENYIRGVYDDVERKYLGIFLLPLQSRNTINERFV